MSQAQFIETNKTRIFSENRTAYEIIWKKYDIDGHVTDDNITRRMRIAC